MRLLLRDSDTGEYYKAPGMWVRSIDEANSFSSLHLLIELSKQLRRVHLEMLAVDSEGTARFGVRLWRDDEPKVKVQPGQRGQDARGKNVRQPDKIHFKKTSRRLRQ